VSDPPSSTARRRFGLKAVLTALVALTVTLTALLIHLSWSYTARENVGEVVEQLNREIVRSIQHELRAVLDNAWSVQEAVRSIFFQGTIKPTDEAKREFVFLAMLRSQPSLSWIAFGWPDGSFFGAEKASDREINMVEVRWDPQSGTATRRIDNYTPEVGDIVFNQRDFAPSTFKATEQVWYRQAMKENGPGWSMITQFPNRKREAISTSTPLVLYDEFVGVINVVIELGRLSQFLTGIEVGRTGTVIVLDSTGRIIASQDPAAIEQQQVGQMPMLTNLAQGGNRLLAITDDLLHQQGFQLNSIQETRQIPFVDSKDGELYYVTFSPLRFQNWYVATIIPAADFLASIERNARMLLIGLVLLTLVMAVIAALAANMLVANPLARIAGQLKFIESFRLDKITRLFSPLRELDDLSAALVQMKGGLASFQKYMPTELVRTLVSQGVEARPGGHHQKMTVLFTDVAGFTGLSEKLGEDVVPVLAEYLELTSSAILGHAGTIDKFIGDAVMAFWGAPLPNENHARDACRAALACQRLLAEQRARAAREGRIPLSMRIGINTGTMLVGNIGSSDRLSYTVIGDPVNLASRLEPLNKVYGTDIIIGEDTRAAAGAGVTVRLLDSVAVYGRTAGVAIYELLDAPDDGPAPPPPDWVRDYEAGLALYRERRWDEAIPRFESVIAARGSDRASEIFIARCRALLVNPPPADWRWVTVLDSK
jgi:adenylate cyclase